MAVKHIVHALCLIHSAMHSATWYAIAIQGHTRSSILVVPDKACMRLPISV